MDNQKHFTQEQKDAMRLDYINNFLTVPVFAEHYGISEAQALEIITPEDDILFSDFSYACLYQNKMFTVDEFIKNHVHSIEWFDYFMSDKSYLLPAQKQLLAATYKQK